MWDRAAALLALITACACVPQEPPEAAYFEAAGRPGEVSTIDTNALPDGIIADVSHRVFHLADEKGFREDSANQIGYVFRFVSGRSIAASVRLDPFEAKALVICGAPDSGQNVMLEACSDSPELRQTMLTLYALDHRSIQALSNAGYVELKRADFSISDADLLDWMGKCTATALEKRRT
jgi:hypothetical protein